LALPEDSEDYLMLPEASETEIISRSRINLSLHKLTRHLL